jgi:hypothetical protein
VGDGDGDGECEGEGEGDCAVVGSEEAGAVSGIRGVCFEVATLCATGLGEEGGGNPAVRAIPPPHEPRKRSAVARLAASTTPRWMANRMASGLMNKIASEMKISATPNVLGASRLPCDHSPTEAVRPSKQRSARMAESPAAIQAPNRYFLLWRNVAVLSRGIHRSPSHLHRPSVEMAGSHCVPSQ